MHSKFEISICLSLIASPGAAGRGLWGVFELLGVVMEPRRRLYVEGVPCMARDACMVRDACSEQGGNCVAEQVWFCHAWVVKVTSVFVMKHLRWPTARLGAHGLPPCRMARGRWGWLVPASTGPCPGARGCKAVP